MKSDSKFISLISGVTLIALFIGLRLSSDLYKPLDVTVALGNENIVQLASIDDKPIPEKPEGSDRFGISLKAYDVVEDKIKPRQFLGQILNEYNVPPRMIDKLARKSAGIFDVRKMRVNNNYKVLLQKDKAHTPKYFIYEHTPTEYIVYGLDTTMEIYRGQRKIDTVQRSFSGVIDYSLYQTAVDQGVNPELVYKLTDVYAWQIDFFRVNKGDRFKVVYEELRVDNQPVGLGKILGATFNYGEESFNAYYFEQEGSANYFDEEGGSLRKAFLKAPLRYSRISSNFSYNRLHPILKVRRPHLGIDYAAPRGTPVRSVGDGVVVKATRSGGAGKMIKIKHNGVYTTGYLHLSGYARGIKPGKAVKQGDVIGYVGSTGLSTGPHLDFRFWKNGSAINPNLVEAPPTEPIKDEFKSAFASRMEEMNYKLNQINYQQHNKAVAIR